MRDLVLVDSQAARVRLFREALAVYRERFLFLQKSNEEARAKARTQLEIARRASRALHCSLAARRAVGNGHPPEEVRLHVFPCEAEALKFLRHEPPYEWAPRPAVVFTDLYLEGYAGTSLVEHLKADDTLRDIPAVVLCSGATAREVREAWDAGSNAVVDLPHETSGMLQRVADTLEFWLGEAAL
jgi:CheY-like chemotaxis protein